MNRAGGSYGLVSKVRSLLLAPYPTYRALGAADAPRRVANRGLFRRPLDDETISDIWLVLTQRRSLGNERFYAKIQRMMGQRRQTKPRGRPR